MHRQSELMPTNVGPAALKTFFNILAQWQLCPRAGQVLLGTTGSTYFRWKKHPEQAQVNLPISSKEFRIFSAFIKPCT